MSSSLSESQKDLIERIGVYHEQQGMQPLMGRILGLLLILDDAEATFEDIIEHLNVSKSAVSTALNVMQIQNRVAYRTKPGERKRYFYLNMGNWEKDIEKELHEIAKVGEFVQEALTLRSNKKTEFNSYLQNLCQFMEYFKKQIPRLFRDFENSKS
ncbi:GbsR/MarR family transcriptional regulator [Aquiflexum lacus]|uniref:GbsR/MarR family transcriptional regulator n=1 Tax=Aquiflexum lacus TaxID=2483805 RepID=UPI001E4C9BEB|nr:ArsR family transcriptional regulator [Aquiflexum lacus]